LKIIIDTDPGQDDAAAIMLALGSPELEVLGITAVAGNVPLALTERNARIVCEMSGRTDIKVFAGAEAPLVQPLVTAEHVHGKTGLDGPELFNPSFPLQDGHAVDFIVETLLAEAPGTVTLCPIGPLTNIALALQKEPSLAGRIQQIVLMGGGYFAQGNITPSRRDRHGMRRPHRHDAPGCHPQGDDHQGPGRADSRHRQSRRPGHGRNVGVL